MQKGGTWRHMGPDMCPESDGGADGPGQELGAARCGKACKMRSGCSRAWRQSPARQGGRPELAALPELAPAPELAPEPELATDVAAVPGRAARSSSSVEGSSDRKSVV